MITVYGIANCDTVKKARAWLTARGVAHTFHDFKKAGVPADRLPAWITAVSLEKLLNRQGTTWRKLEPAVQTSAANEAGARALMLANPSVIRRPVVDWGGAHALITAGFNAQVWDGLVASDGTRQS